MKTLVVGGGVSANAWLRTRLQDYCDKHGILFCIPERSLSTDNGAMIAAAAIRRKLQGKLVSVNEVKPWMPLAL
jgi:N6-L-threonylcarbamoyladenine synthase